VTGTAIATAASTATASAVSATSSATASATALTGAQAAARGAAPLLKRATTDGLDLLRSRFSRVLAAHGCRTTDHFAGFQITGRFRTDELVALIRALPEGSTELMCHPGRATGELQRARTRLKESREQELAALIAPETRRVLAESGVELVNYRTLERAWTITHPPPEPR
jgi:predicted glycoside hydrolase/deacetylase ChbG (UPF0249 family)